MSLSRLISTFRKKLALDHRSRNRRPTSPVSASIEVLTTRVLLSATNPFSLSSLNGTNGFRLEASIDFGVAGTSVSSAGDINGDGYDDVIIGAPTTNYFYRRTSYIVFGKSGGFLSTIDLMNLDGTNGFRLETQFGDNDFGGSVSGAGDVNGDGFDDLIIGAVDHHFSGSSYVLFGKSGAFSPVIDVSTLNGTNGFRITSASLTSLTGSFGYSVSGAGDVNGDGFDDLIIGAPEVIDLGVSFRRSYVFFGKSGGFAPVIYLNTLDSTNGFRLDGPGSIFSTVDDGLSVSGAGDVNGDGFDDLIVGEKKNSPNGISQAGSTYVVFGKSDGFSAVLALSTLNGTNGFRLNGTNPHGLAGASVSNAGDINGDGFDDLLIGAPRDSGIDRRAPRSSYVVFGKSSGFNSVIDLSTIDGTNGFRLEGADVHESGNSVSGAGDINGDGFDDLIIGAALGDHPTASEVSENTGSSYVMFGKAGNFSAAVQLSSLNGTNGFRLDGVVKRDQSGTSVHSAGDVNGDGFDDVVVGAPGVRVGRSPSAGSSYVVFGGNFTGGSETTVGTSGSEILTANLGPSAADILIGGQGNDTLISDGGSDVLIGGEGDDILALSDTDFSGTRRLLGGTGKNTLRLDGSGLTLDLTSIKDNRIVNINEIDIIGSGANTLILNAREVLNLSGRSNTLVVWQDSNDVVTAGPGWIVSGLEMIAGSAFRVLTQGAAKLKVQIPSDAPSVTHAVTIEDVQTSSGLVIRRNSTDGTAASHFKITGITGGTLFQNDGTSPINVGDFITFAQANAGLKFTPTLNSIVTGHFTVQSSLSSTDSGLRGAPVIADIIVSAVADTPSVTNAFTFTNSQTFTGLVISRNTADGSEVTHFRITGISGGVLFQNDGTSKIRNGDFITFAQANAGLKFTPSLNSIATGQFMVQASTSGVVAGLGGGTVVATISVKAPPGVPTVTSATTSEDVQTSSGLVISRNSSDGAEVTHFRITGITGGHLFKNDGVSHVNDGDFITSADAGAGLKFTPSPDFSGTGHFTVQAAVSSDNSGAKGTTVTADISVSPVADTPSVTNALTDMNTQTTSGLVISRNAADGAEVTHFKITRIVGGSLFQNNGTSPINDGDFITFAQANAGLKFTPTLDSTVTGNFTVQASIGNSDAGLGGIAVTAEIALRPAAPVLTALVLLPSSQRPAITWNATPDADYYIVAIRKQNSTVVLKAVTGTTFSPTADLGIGRFSVAVRAVSVSGASSLYSAERSLTIVTPAVFKTVVSFQSTANPSLDWLPLTGAVKYDLWIDNLTTGEQQVVREMNLTGSSWTSRINLPMGKYRAWIRGIGAAQIPAAWSKMVDFHVLPTVPVTGSLRSTFDTTPTFKWSAVAGATGYDLYLRNLTTGKIVRSPKDIVGTSFTQPTNLPAGNYRWSVYAVTQGGFRSQAATAQDIEIGRLPVILTPAASTTDTTPRISWTPVDDAATYILFVNRVDVLVRGIVDVSGITGTNYTTDALPIGSYRAWVRAVSATGEISVWSGMYEFSIIVESTTVPKDLLPIQLTALEVGSSQINERASSDSSTSRMAATQSSDEAPTDSDGSHSANGAPARSKVNWSAKDQILPTDSADLRPIRSVDSENIAALMAELSATDALLMPFI